MLLLKRDSSGDAHPHPARDHEVGAILDAVEKLAAEYLTPKNVRLTIYVLGSRAAGIEVERELERQEK